MKFDNSFEFGDRVYIDGDVSIIARITGITVRVRDYISVECSYFQNGEAKTAWVELDRLTKADI